MAKKKKKEEALEIESDFLVEGATELVEPKVNEEEVLGELDLNKIPGKFRRLIGRK